MSRRAIRAPPPRQCEQVLAWLESRQSVWWQGCRALTQARLALIVAAEDEERGRTLLATALRDASEWVELPPLAGVIAAFALRRPRPSAGRPSADLASADLASAGLASAGQARLAATLLGGAYSVRGAYDEASLDAPAVRAAALGQLGPAGFEAAYSRGRDLAREQVLALASGVLEPASQPAAC